MLTLWHPLSHVTRGLSWVVCYVKQPDQTKPFSAPWWLYPADQPAWWPHCKQSHLLICVQNKRFGTDSGSIVWENLQLTTAVSHQIDVDTVIGKKRSPTLPMSNTRLTELAHSGPDYDLFNVEFPHHLTHLLMPNPIKHILKVNKDVVQIFTMLKVSFNQVMRLWDWPAPLLSMGGSSVSPSTQLYFGD